MSLLSIENLTKDYSTGGKTFSALHGVSLYVNGNECVGLIGESGSGKSTIANIVAGRVSATGGTVTYDGSLLTGKRVERSARNTMQMVFQSPTDSFSPRMRLGKGIREGLRYLSDLPKSEQEALVEETMRRVGLPIEYKSKHVTEISGGEAQRAAIARAVLIRPKLLICDEITSALDAEVQEQLIELLKELKREMGMAFLFISHDIRLVRSFCDRVYVMREGVIVEQGGVRSLFEHPEDDYTRRLIEASYLQDAECEG